MKVEFNIDDTQLKTLLQQTVNELPKETLQELVLECIRKCLTESKVIENMFISSSWGGKEPTNLLRNCISESIKREDEIQSITDEMVNILKTNHIDILVAAMHRVFINGIVDDHRVQSAMKEAVDITMFRHKNEIINQVKNDIRNGIY